MSQVEFLPGDVVCVEDAHGQETATVLARTEHGDYWVRVERTGRECTAPGPTLHLIQREDEA